MTLFLAWINAKYDYGYEMAFVGTFLIDIQLISLVSQYLAR